MGTQPPPQNRGQSLPIFGPSLSWPHGWMHQDATWYGGRPRPTRHCVRCGPSYPQKMGTPTHPIFGPCLLWPNGWMDEDAAWYQNGSRPRPRPHCTRRGPRSQLQRKGHSSPPLFGPCLLWPRSPISPAAELLYNRSKSGKVTVKKVDRLKRPVCRVTVLKDERA